MSVAHEWTRIQEQEERCSLVLPYRNRYSEECDPRTSGKAFAIGKQNFFARPTLSLAYDSFGVGPRQIIERE